MYKKNRIGGKVKKIGNNKFNQNFLLIVSVVLVIILIITLVLFKIKSNQKADNLVYDEFDAIGGKIDDNQYYIFGAKNDITFKVEKQDNFSYKIYDQDKKEVWVNTTEEDNILTIKYPDEFYAYGETYYLEIENGKFLDNKYKDYNKIIFSIARPAKQSFTLNDNVINVNINDITVDDKLIKTNKEYEDDDIILVYDNEEIKKVYKIVKEKDNNQYEYVIPNIKEVFKDIDYYGNEKINLANFENDSNFNLFLISTIKEKVLNSLVSTVYAKENVTINKPIWNKKEQCLDVGITIDMNNSNDFLSNHNSKVELTLSVSIDLYRDITIDNYDYALVINYKAKVNNNLKHINNDFNTFYETIKDKDKIDNFDTKWLEENYSKLSNDKVKIDKSLGNINVPTKVPGLSFSLDLGVLFDIDTKSIITSSLTSDNTLVVGYNNNVGLYKDYTFNNNSSITFIGDDNSKIGSTIDTNLDFLNIHKLNTKLMNGLYTTGKSTVTVDKKDDKDIGVTFDISGNSGFYGKYLVSANSTEETTLFDNQEAIAKYEKKIKLLKKQEEEKKDESSDENKVTYKYTSEQVREMLQQGYDVLKEKGEWNSSMGTMIIDLNTNKTIDVSKNEFVSTWNYNNGAASYSYTYNYVDNTMKCDNFEGAQNYIKGICNNLYNEYLKYQDTGETEIDEAMEWEDMYGDLDSCYYEAISVSEPTDFKDDIKRILDEVSLTFEDLEVLKN